VPRRSSELNLPEVISRLTYLPRGLVLVTGDTGSGKSTTLAAMIDAMNERYRKHIITLEDPVEYALVSNKCLIEQRELGQDMPASPPASSTPCVRTRTSSSSAKCVTWTPRRWR
jgi:Tfp pilus assembly pilus retraction ATPase PilT